MITVEALAQEMILNESASCLRNAHERATALLPFIERHIAAGQQPILPATREQAANVMRGALAAVDAMTPKPAGAVPLPEVRHRIIQWPMSKTIPSATPEVLPISSFDGFSREELIAYGDARAAAAARHRGEGGGHAGGWQGLLDQVLRDTAKELGCEPDNELILEAIHALKARKTKAIDVAAIDRFRDAYYASANDRFRDAYYASAKGADGSVFLSIDATRAGLAAAQLAAGRADAVPAVGGDNPKRWPFVESPGEFTKRLWAALAKFPLLGAVRHVLIENPPTFAPLPQQPTAEGVDTFQARVAPWMAECFGQAIASDVRERGDRLLEEVLELLQSHGYDPSRVATLRDYVFGRPVGEPAQEVGGVMVTLAAYCLATGIDMHAAGETELARIWTKVETIRAKQASKRDLHSPLPAPAPQQMTTQGELREAIRKFDAEPGVMLRDRLENAFVVIAAARRLTGSQP